MPMKVTETAAAGAVHPSPFIGPINHQVGILVDVSTLTTDEVDNYGYLKPGVILTQTGDLVSLTTEVAYGAVIEAVKVAPAGSDSTALAAITTDVEVAVGLWVLLNRDILEDSLGRAVSANELLAINAAGSHVALTNT